MKANRITAVAAALAMLSGCATADDYRSACQAEHPDTGGVENCAQQRADRANTQAVVLTVVGVVVIGAIAAAAAGAGDSSKNDYEWIRCYPLGCPPQNPR